MFRRKALRKIFVATMSLFILLFVVTITSYDDSMTLKTNLEIEEIAGFNISSVYLLNDNNLLVRSKTLIKSESEKERVKEVVTNLIVNNSNILVDGLYGIIPSDVEIKDIFVGNRIVTIDFSKVLW